MKTILTITILISLITGYLPAQDANVPKLEFNKDGFLIINGKPTLMIGLYAATLPNSDEMAKELAENGFNIARVRDCCLFYPEKFKAELDRFHKYGLYGWGSLEYVTYRHENTERLKELVTQLKDHPALIGWEIPDEIIWNIWCEHEDWVKVQQPKELKKLIEQSEANIPQSKITELKKMLEDADSYSNRGLVEKAETLYDKLWTELGKQNPKPQCKLSKRQAEFGTYMEKLAQNRKLIKEIDPVHFIIANHACRHSIKILKKFNSLIDIVSCDIYPAPEYRMIIQGDLNNRTLSCVGEYTRRMKQGAEEKPLWMLLQGFGWRDLQGSLPCRNSPDKDYGRRPNFRESNFMVYDAIVNGASGIVYWGVHYADFVDKDNQLKKDLFEATRRLRALEPAIVAEKPEKLPVITIGETGGSVDGPELQSMLRKTADGEWVLIITNPTTGGIPFTISQLPDELNGKKLHLLYSDESSEIKNGQFDDGVEAFGVNIYSTSRKFEVE